MSYSYFASVYDELTKNVEYKKRADYFCSLLTDNGISGGLLLDLACGTGSLSVELAKNGYNVIGVDLSEDMLSVAQTKNYENGTDILFLCQDMCALDLYGTVDCCVCALDSLNHLKDENEVLEAFKNVSLFMDDNGIFIFDMNTLYKHREILNNQSFVYEPENMFCTWQNTLLDDKCTVKIDLDFFEQIENGIYERFTEEFYEKAYEPELIRELLKKADFELINEFEELTHNAPKQDTQRTVFVARRIHR